MTNQLLCDSLDKLFRKYLVSCMSIVGFYILEIMFFFLQIQHLSCIGGDSVSSLVRRILRRVISSEVAVKYNFSGAKGKNSFHTLQLRGVLIGAWLLLDCFDVYHNL